MDENYLKEGTVTKLLLCSLASKYQYFPAVSVKKNTFLPTLTFLVFINFNYFIFEDNS